MALALRPCNGGDLEIQKTTLAFIIGWGFYAVAELAALMDGIGVWQILNPTVPAPLWILPYETMFAKPFFMMATVPATGFLLLALNYDSRLGPFQRALLSFMVVWTMFLAIPDMMFPLGDIYYETLKFYFGLSSLVFAFITLLLYVPWRRG